MRTPRSGTVTTDSYDDKIRRKNGPTNPVILLGNAVCPGAHCQTHGGDTGQSGLTEPLGLPGTPSIGLLQNNSALRAKTAWGNNTDI